MDLLTPLGRRKPKATEITIFKKSDINNYIKVTYGDLYAMVSDIDSLEVHPSGGSFTTSPYLSAIYTHQQKETL